MKDQKILTSKEIVRAHGLYQCGMSLSKVAERVGSTRQRLHGYFKRMGLKTRSLKKGEPIEINGVKYYPDSQGYYRGGNPRHYAHHKVWDEEIPEDCVLSFKDKNKSNITKENLCLVKKSEMHNFSQKQNQFTKKKNQVS